MAVILRYQARYSNSPTVSELADELERDHDTVLRALYHMDECGWIRLDHTPHRKLVIVPYAYFERNL